MDLIIYNYKENKTYIIHDVPSDWNLIDLGNCVETIQSFIVNKLKLRLKDIDYHLCKHGIETRDYFRLL